MTIIGLAGFAGCGKTSIGNAIPGVHDAFARELKRRAAQAIGIGVDELECRKSEFRPLLVELGRAGRRVDPKRWIIPVIDRVLQCEWVGPGEPTYIIDDVRYSNEAEDIAALGGHVFYIHRPGVGPANDEERNSIAELRRVLQPRVVVNVEGKPELAAAEMLAIVKGCAA